MANLQQGNSKIWYDEQLIEDVSQDLFNPSYWQAANRIVGQAKGRNTTWFIQTETMTAALRHYYRGGLFGRLVKDSYWFTGFDNTRSAQEFALLQHLHRHGLAVPRPIAAQAIKTGLTYRADILLEKIANAEDLVARLKQTALTLQDYQRIGALIAQMHNLQVCHTDLNIRNILVDEQNNYWLIDFDKCFIASGDDWKAGNLARLLRSFHKELIRESIQWQSECWQALLDGYNNKVNNQCR